MILIQGHREAVSIWKCTRSYGQSIVDVCRKKPCRVDVIQHFKRCCVLRSCFFNEKGMILKMHNVNIANDALLSYNHVAVGRKTLEE